MKIVTLIDDLRKFIQAVNEHFFEWEKKIKDKDTKISYDFLLQENPELQLAVPKSLLNKFEILKPYIFLFHKEWKIFDVQNQLFSLDIIEAVFTPSSINIKAICKSKEEFINILEKVINELEKYPKECEIPPLLSRSVNTSLDLDFFMLCNLNCLHPYIDKGCSKLFLDGHYAQAVEESVKAVMQYIRDKTGLTKDGDGLITQVFSQQNPILRFSDLSTETLRNEQLGFMNMLQGFVKGVRNVFAHTHGKQEEARKAYEYLFMASLFCRRIDESYKTTP